RHIRLASLTTGTNPTAPHLLTTSASHTLRRATEAPHGTRPRCPARLRAGLRCADPLYAAHARLLSGDRLHHAVSLGAPYRRTVPAAEKAARPIARHHRHHRCAVSSGQGRPRSRRGVQWWREVLPGLLRRHVATARPPHLAHRLRP